MAVAVPVSAEQAGVDPLSPLWWLARLGAKLAQRQDTMKAANDWYTGRHPLPFLTKAHAPKMRDEFRQLLEQSRSNFMRLVVDAVEERLHVEGFRLSASTDETADQESWKIWQANGLDSESQIAIVEALVKGLCYLSVWAPVEQDGYAQIAVEDPMETIVAYTAGSNYRQREAALKVWDDTVNGVRRANVYLPDGIYKFFRPVDSSELRDGKAGYEIRGWEPVTGDDFVRNPLRVVPIIPLRNRPRLGLEGESELVDVTTTQDRINGQLFLRSLAGYFGAHRQRYVSGIKLYDDDTGEALEPFDVAIDTLWASEDPNVKFGEFSQTDLAGYIKAIEQDVLHIAVTSRTPRHYLIEQGQSPSGDAIRSAEAGLVAKVTRKMRPFGEAFEETIRLARRFQGAEDAPVDSEIVWADPQTRTEAETTDAVIKQHGAGLIPWEAALEKLGYSQTQIARYAAMRASDQLLRALLNPTPPPAETETEPEVV